MYTEHGVAHMNNTHSIPTKYTDVHRIDGILVSNDYARQWDTISSLVLPNILIKFNTYWPTRLVYLFISFDLKASFNSGHIDPASLG